MPCPTPTSAKKILDITDRDDAPAVLVVPEWPYQAWWCKLHLAPERVSGAALIPTTQGCFFGTCFTTRALAIRTRAVGPCNE